MDDLHYTESATMQSNTRFQALQTETEKILNATTREDIHTAVCNSIYKLLDTPYTQLYLYNRRGESLTTLSQIPTTTIKTPEETTPHTENIHDTITTQTVKKDDPSILWDTYTETDGELLQSSDQINTLTAPSHTNNTGIVLPLGPYGVLLILESEHVTFTEIDLHVGEFLAAAITRSLDNERRERGLATVQAVTRDAMTAQTHHEMSALVLDQLPEVLDYPICAIWKYNEFKHQLEPVGTTGPAQTVVPDHPVFKPGNSIAWDVFETNDTRVIPDVPASPQSYNSDSPIKSEVITSIGDFGVFAAGSTRAGSFNSTEKQIIDSLSTNLQTIVKLVERHGELQLLDDVLGRVIRHNIRNELNIIKGNGNIIHETDKNSDLYNTSYDEFIDACERLKQTAENAQLMREVVRNRTETISIDVETAIEQTVREIQTEYPNTTLEFNRDAIKTTTTLDLHTNFQDGIKELLVNAVKHTEENQSAEITIRIHNTDDTLTITITDNGPGISQDELNVLETDRESTLHHGSGAGLWAVDRIISHSGGKLDFTVNNGTTAEITLRK